MSLKSVPSRFVGRDVSHALSSGPRRVRPIAVAVAAASVALAVAADARAADVVKDDNNAALNDPTSWVGGVVPTAADIAVWNSTLATPANANETIAAAVTFGGIRILNPSAPIVIDAQARLNINNGGIDMSAATADLTIGSTTLTGAQTVLGLGAGAHAWNVANGRTLTFTSPYTTVQPAQNGNPLLVRVSTTGSVVFTQNVSQATVFNTGSNPYMTYGLDDWAATDATGKVIAATYTVPAAGGATVAGANIDIQNATATSASTSINSMRFSNTAAPSTLTVTGSNTATIRGILMTSNSVGGTITGGFVRNNRGSASSNVVFPMVQNSTLGDLTITSNIANASSSTTGIAKFGAGNIILNNAAGNGYSAANLGTQIYEGTLTLANTSNSATGAGPVAVQNGARLAGTGISSGLTTVNSGGRLSPGSYSTSAGVVTRGVGTLTLGSLTLNAGSILDYDFNGTTSNDLINVTVTGAGTAGTGLTLNGGGFNLLQANSATPFTSNGTYNLIQYAGAIAGTGIGALSVLNADPNKNYTFGESGGFVTLSIATIGVVANEWKDLDGSWTTGSNWTLGSAPNAAGAIAQFGGGSVSFTGPRTVNLNSGQTVGTLAFNSASNVTISGASTLTLDNSGENAFITNALGTHTINTPINVVSGGVSVGVVGAGDVTTLGGALSGTTNLVKTGAGRLVLAADNAYTGNTAIVGGTVQVGNGGSTGTLGGGDVVNAGTLAFNRSGALAVNGAISGSGAVTVDGGLTLTLGGTNSFTGATTLNNGSLVLNNAAALAGSTLNYNSGSVTFGTTGATATFGGLSGTGNLVLTDAAANPVVLTVGGNNSTSTYNGVLSGTGGLTKAGNGTLTLNTAHSYAGATTVNGGNLILTGSASVNGGPIVTGGTGTFTLNGGTVTSTGASAINVNTSMVINSGTVTLGTLALNPTNGSSNALYRQLAGTVTVDSISSSRLGGDFNATAGGLTTAGFYLTGGTLNVTGAFGLGTITGTNSGQSLRIENGATVNVGGPLTLALNNTGRTTVVDVNGASLNVADTTTGIHLGGTVTGNARLILRREEFSPADAVVNTGKITFGSPALDASATPGSATIDLQNGMINVGSGGMQVATTNPLYTANVLVTSGTIGATADWTGNANFTFNGTPTFRASDGAPTPVAHDITLTGKLSGNVGPLGKQGAGKLILTGANDYNGPTQIDEGTLVGGNAKALSNGQVTIASGARLEVQQGFAGALMLTGMPNTNAGSVIDVTNSGLIIDYNGGTPISNVRDLAAANTLRTSLTAGDARVAVGYLESASLPLTETSPGVFERVFRGVVVDNEAIVIKGALKGDTNLDSTVNFADLLSLAQAYNTPGGNAVWGQGDFNYDGQVTFPDLLSLAQNYNSTLTGSFAGDWSLAQSLAVPEPTTLAALAGTAGLALRRRRRQA